MLIRVFMMQESIDHAKFRAQSQLMIDPQKGKDAFEDYMKIAFPYMEGMRRRATEEITKMLKRETSRALVIRPTAPIGRKSALQPRRRR